ncbi:hypothetical protein FACS1894123_03990 [Bacteroidia bacterium]|nr:hypothetical protein FACS1894123_03990 [Bacteroidia bacterium]
MTDIARNIKQIRELKSYTQEYVANELGISQPAYAKIEQGTTILKIDRLQHILLIFWKLSYQHYLTLRIFSISSLILLQIKVDILIISTLQELIWKYSERLSKKK